jgi:hypothetical protein
VVERPNQVWTTGIALRSDAGRFLCLVAAMDWFFQYSTLETAYQGAQPTAVELLASMND